MTTLLDKAIEVLKNSKHTTAFTGAGISVESGIPPFRGPEGLWSKYDPQVLDIGYFNNNPYESWTVIKEIFYDFFGGAVPNSAHKALVSMEQNGLLAAIITQNIDDLHQKAGSKNVIEYHGNSQKLICPHCNKQFRPDEVDLNNLPPHCPDDAYVLKPDFVFFGEAIPGKASLLSSEESQHAEVFLLVGTTGEVMPASMVPRFAKDSGAIIIEINPEESLYTTEITDIFLRGKAGKILPELVRKLLAG